MKRNRGARWLLVGSLVLLAAGGAAAQTPSAFYQQPGVNPYQRPTISPYLNLVRPGLPAANYYLLVQPQFQQRSINAVYGSALVDLERRANQSQPQPVLGLPPPLGPTGHPTAFVNYGTYFNFGNVSPGGRGAPAPTPAPIPPPPPPAPRPAEGSK